MDPIMNNNRHDDILCTDGVNDNRPCLLPEDGVVEKSDIMKAAARYEEQLNSR